MKTGHPTTAIDLFETVNFRTGDRVAKILLSGEEGAPNNYQFGYSWGKEATNWETPRHHHNFEQIRHPIKGDYSIGKDRFVPEGWVAYFPESAFYGPQSMTPDLVMTTMQYGGPSGQGYWSLRQQRKALAECKARGKFENGAFTYTDADGRRHNQDAGEAMWEQAFGHVVDYPEPRFEALVLMNPATFTWMKDRDQPGVARKQMGSFTEREIKVGFIRVEKGASFIFGHERSPEALLIKEGALKHDDTVLPTLSAVGTATDEAPVTLVAAEPTELYYLKLPTF